MIIVALDKRERKQHKQIEFAELCRDKVKKIKYALNVI